MSDKSVVLSYDECQGHMVLSFILRTDCSIGTYTELYKAASLIRYKVGH